MSIIDKILATHITKYLMNIHTHSYNNLEDYWEGGGCRGVDFELSKVITLFFVIRI
jgi:hypothetical protein